MKSDKQPAPPNTDRVATVKRKILDPEQLASDPASRRGKRVEGSAARGKPADSKPTR